MGDFTSSAKQADVSPVSWFYLPKGSFTVKSRVQTKFAYTVQAPTSAAVGGHYGAIFIETLPPPGQGAAFVSRIERIGSLFYFTVKGDLHRSGSIAGLTAAFLQSTSPVRATLRLRNDGNVHFLAEGTAQLSSLFGNVSRPKVIKGEVLPGTTRRFDLILPPPRRRSVCITFLILSGALLLLIILECRCPAATLQETPQPALTAGPGEVIVGLLLHRVTAV